MSRIRNIWLGSLVSFIAMSEISIPASAQQQQKPNIVVIMGDDIGMWNIGAYHRGMMAGKTPNLDKIAKEGMLFTDYYAEASCTAGRANFITGELPIRTGMTTVGQAGASPARAKLRSLSSLPGSHSKAERISFRQPSASRRSTMTGRCGWNIRCTPNWPSRSIA
jgi:sulfatase-like protein